MVRIVSHPLGPLPPIAPRVAPWRAELDAAIVAAPGTAGLITLLHQPEALVVTTGQQPGLFTGPLYAVHKALAAAALADELTSRWKRPVVPLFWVAGDDHDFAEGSVAAWAGADGTLRRWSLPARDAAAPQLPLSEEQLPASVDEGLAFLEATLPPGESRDRTLEWLRRHYVAGATLQRACAGAVAELLAPHGVLCLDPTSSAFKQAQVPLLQRALKQATELDTALARIPDAGTGITAGEGATLVFLTTAVGRERLMTDGPGFRARRSGERFTLAQLDALVKHEPDRFSANVLLRPVIESALLPTVAYVAGPGEMRYLKAQASVLYPLLDVPRQTPVPRWSGTVIFRWAERLLRRLGVSVRTVLEDDGRQGRAILERNFPGDVRQALVALQNQIERGGRVITAAGVRIDPVLERAIAGRTGRLRQEVQGIEHVLQRHLRKRADTEYSQWIRLRGGLHPDDQPQERVFTAATFLSRYGGEWLDGVATEARTWAETLPGSGE